MAKKMTHCANCQTELRGPFCSTCGQKATDLHQPIWWIMGEFLDSVFSYDSRTLRTLYLLFGDPGEFTRLYNSGRRASVLPPFRLFIIASVLFFGALEFSSVALMQFKPVTQQVVNLPPEAAKELEKDLKGSGVDFKVGGRTTGMEFDMFVPLQRGQGNVTLTPAQRKDLDESMKAADEGAKKATAENGGAVDYIIEIGRRATHGFRAVLEDPLRLNTALNTWVPRMMLILVPVFAMLLAFVHWWPRAYYIEHLVFSLHIHTALFVALSVVVGLVALTGSNALAWTVAPIFGVYVWMAIHRVYQRGPILTTFKFVALGVIYSLVFLVSFFSMFMLALSTV